MKPERPRIFWIATLAVAVKKFPGYVSQLQTLAENPSHPWLRKIIGEGLSEAEQATGPLGVSWIMSFLDSLWSGGKASGSPGNRPVPAPDSRAPKPLLKEPM